MPPLLIVLAAAALTAASAPLWRGILRGPGWTDLPRADRHHVRPVSRAGGACWLSGFCGGILIGAVALGPWGGAEASPGDPAATARRAGCTAVLLAAPLLAFALGRADDRGRIGPGAKWVMQTILLAATCAALARLSADDARFSWSGRAILGALAVVALQTALQIFDNLDGALAVVCAAGFASVAWATQVPCDRAAALAGGGASLGFLLWNRPPARMFLGNAGSQAVALPLCALLLDLFLAPARNRSGAGSAGWALLPLAWPLADLVFVTAARLRRGVPPWQGGRDHTTHRLARALGSDARAAAAIALVSAAGLALACRLLGGPR